MNAGYYVNAVIYGAGAAVSFVLSLLQFYLGYYRSSPNAPGGGTSPMVRTLLLAIVFASALLVIRAVDPDGCFYSYDQSIRQYTSCNCTVLILSGFGVWLVQLFDSVSRFDGNSSAGAGGGGHSATKVAVSVEQSPSASAKGSAVDGTPSARRVSELRAAQSRYRSSSSMDRGLQIVMAGELLTANVGTGIAHAINKWWPTAIFLGITCLFMVFLFAVLWYSAHHVRTAIGHAKSLHQIQPSTSMTDGLSKLNAALRKLNTVHFCASVLLVASAIVNTVVAVDRLESAESLDQALGCDPTIYRFDAMLWAQLIAILLAQAYVWQPVPKQLCARDADPTLRVRIRGSSYVEEAQ